MARTMDRLGTTAAHAGLEVSVAPGLPGRAHVTVSGEIDLDNAPILREAVLTAVACYRTGVTVDLRQVTFCDCAGLNVLLAARDTAERRHRSLCVTHTGHFMERLLRITGTRAALS
ncbi:STAS domain-containing protein [Streptomyces sp. NPDC058525]|uniref:STAS domain-containing protein n=1 Tax=unclassified Streptomyces TaxID=2593676 RepID=UPI003647CB62